MPNPTFQTFVGVAKETTKGTLVASPADYIPVKGHGVVDHQTFLEDQGMRGSQVDSYDQIAGVTWAEFSYNGDVFPDTIGYPLAGILGDVTTTGGSAPFSHAMAVKNNTDGQPVSDTLTEWNGVTARQIAAAQHSDLSFTFAADGLLDYTAKASGFISATASQPTRSYTSVAPIPNWKGIVTIAGSTAATLIDGTVDMKRTVTPINTIDGTAAPYKMWAGPLVVTGKLSFVTETEAQMVNYLTNAQPSVDLDFQQGASAALTEVKFHMTKCAFLTAVHSYGKDWVQTDVTYKAVPNTTDVGASAGYSPLKITLQSAKAASTYA